MVATYARCISCKKEDMEWTNFCTFCNAYDTLILLPWDDKDPNK